MSNGGRREGYEAMQVCAGISRTLFDLRGVTAVHWRPCTVAYWCKEHTDYQIRYIVTG